MSEEDRRDVGRILTSLEPVMFKRVVMASKLSPETLPEELLLLESVVVLRRELES